VLALGTVFSWFTSSSTTAVLRCRGHVFEVAGCAVDDPLVTPCFYGALAFLAALLWQLHSRPRTSDDQLTGLNWLRPQDCLCWGNFAYEVYRFQPAATVGVGLQLPKEAPWSIHS